MPILAKYFGGITPAGGAARLRRRPMRPTTAIMHAVRRKGEECLRWHGAKGTASASSCSAGRPYHHGPGDQPRHRQAGCVAGLRGGQRGLRVPPCVERPNVHVLNQWTYHARLYRAARYVATAASGHESGAAGVLRLRRGRHHHRRGARAFWRAAGSIYTQIKIDEITNLGAVKIRLRSLFAAHWKRRRRTSWQDETLRPIYQGDEAGPTPFWCPTCCRIHFKLIVQRLPHLRLSTWSCWTTTGRRLSTTGLKYVHNDTCYPAHSGHRPVHRRAEKREIRPGQDGADYVPRPAAAVVRRIIFH